MVTHKFFSGGAAFLGCANKLRRLESLRHQGAA